MKVIKVTKVTKNLKLDSRLYAWVNHTVNCHEYGGDQFGFWHNPLAQNILLRDGTRIEYRFESVPSIYVSSDNYQIEILSKDKFGNCDVNVTFPNGEQEIFTVTYWTLLSKRVPVSVL